MKGISELTPGDGDQWRWRWSWLCRLCAMQIDLIADRSAASDYRLEIPFLEKVHLPLLLFLL
jgi:hypothetical protein